MKVEGKIYRQFFYDNVTIEWIRSNYSEPTATNQFELLPNENPNLPYLTFPKQQITDSTLETCKHIYNVQQNILQFLEVRKISKVGLFGLVNCSTLIQLKYASNIRDYGTQINEILANTPKFIDNCSEGGYFDNFNNELQKRALLHDKSKFSEKEKPYFDAFSSLLSECEYGSEMYIETMQLIKPAIENHYKENSHHPEHYQNGINGMNLFDVIEMFCDWNAACKRNKNGNFGVSITKNKERFGMSEELTQLFIETKDVLGW